MCFLSASHAGAPYSNRGCLIDSISVSILPRRSEEPDNWGIEVEFLCPSFPPGLPLHLPTFGLEGEGGTFQIWSKEPKFKENSVPSLHLVPANSHSKRGLVCLTVFINTLIFNSPVWAESIILSQCIGKYHVSFCQGQMTDASRLSLKRTLRVWFRDNNSSPASRPSMQTYAPCQWGRLLRPEGA